MRENAPPSPRPVLRLPGTVLFPRDVSTIEVRRPDNLAALEQINALDGLCVVVPLIGGPEAELPGVGVLARLVSRTLLFEDEEDHADEKQRVVLQGLRRVGLVDVRREQEGGCFLALTEPLARMGSARTEQESRARRRGLDHELRRLQAELSTLAELDPGTPRELRNAPGLHGDDPDRLTDLIATGLSRLGFEERAALACEPDALERLVRLNQALDTMLVEERLRHDLDRRVDDHARRRLLRDQLRALREELGETDGHARDVRRLNETLAELDLPAGAHRHLAKELECLERSSHDSPEAARLRNYLEWAVKLPWRDPAAEASSGPGFQHVSAVLSKSHVGLTDVKRRIFEFLAVRELGGGARGTVMCFHGPPGTGKSSMARTVASAMGRPFVAISMGAITHEGEIVGTSHKREGGMPGAILEGLARNGGNDPVVLLDEIDKVSLGGEGTAGGPLLQLLDPEQNAEFLDQYLGVPFDLSNCLFLATANEIDTIPEAMIDRMETIEFNGYTEEEKYAIAREHLVPRARKHAGVTARQFQLSPGALRAIILRYTEEAGVRQLQRHLISLARKAAVRVVRGEDGLQVKKGDLVQLLGPRTVDEDLRLRRPAIGVATGLAWTTAGGALLPIEALAMPGAGRLILTGLIGDVMRESVQTAISYVRTCFGRLGLHAELFDTLDIHLHFPSAATPKDGPSAGVAIACAVLSLITKKPTRHTIAMTGEVSLLGQVLAVGGIREKILAAIRAGIPEVIVPARNAEEIQRLDVDVHRRVTIHLIDDVREAFELALVLRKSSGQARLRLTGTASAARGKTRQSPSAEGGAT